MKKKTGPNNTLQIDLLAKLIKLVLNVAEWWLALTFKDNAAKIPASRGAVH